MAVQTYAIMAIDPGMTSGISQIHIYSGHTKGHKGKLPDHTVVRFRAFELPVTDPPLTPVERAHMDYRDFTVKNPYRKYTAHAFHLLQEWRRFRTHAVSPRGFGIPPQNVFLVIEDYIFSSSPKDTRMPAMSPVFIANQLIGLLEGMGYSQEEFGLGPTSVNSISFLAPSEKRTFNFANLMNAGLWTMDYSKSKRGRKLEHANDATLLALAMARKINIPGLVIPFKGERPEPFMAKFRPSPDEPDIYHHSGQLTNDPADPHRPAPRRARTLGRSGQDAYKRAVKEDPLRSFLIQYPLIPPYIMSKAGEEYDIMPLRDMLASGEWARFKGYLLSPKHGYTTKGSRGSTYIVRSTPKLLRLCQKALGPKGMRAIRRTEAAD